MEGCPFVTEAFNNDKESDFSSVCSRCYVRSRIWSARGREGELRRQVLRSGPGCRKTHSGRDSCDLVSDMQGASADPERSRKAGQIQQFDGLSRGLRFPERCGQGVRSPNAEHADYVQGVPGDRPLCWRYEPEFDCGLARQSDLMR